jgi:hypothetical protein
MPYSRILAKVTMKQAMVRNATYDSVYQSYLVTNLPQLSSHP